LTTTLAAPTRLDGGTTGAPDRVRPAQRQAAAALAQAGAFGVAAGLALVLADGRWLALHLFLAGTLVSAISGVSVLFAVTWSAAPCPPARRSALQRALVGAGAAGVAVTRHVDAPAPLLAVAALAFAAGLAMLAAELVVTVRRGVQRRFDAAVAWYVAALAAGLVAASLGAAMGAGWGGAGLRPAHVTLNLLGLVGFVIAGTLPTFVATQGRTKGAAAAHPSRLRALLGWQVVALAVAAVGAGAEHRALAAAGLAGYAAGLASLAALLPRPTRRSVGWGGPRLLGLWAGSAWWAAAVVAGAVAAADGRAPLPDPWLAVLVVAGYAQILWASLAYLGPVLRAGGHERLGEGFATTRSWGALAAANLAGLGLAAGWGPVAAVAGAAWALDTVARAARLVGSQA